MPPATAAAETTPQTGQYRGCLQGNPPEPVVRPRSIRPPSRRRFLAFKQCRNLVNAAVYAEARGTPLTWHVTIWWKHSAGFSPEPRAWLRHQGRLFNRLADWLRAKDIEPVWLWVREAADVKREHTHLLIALPLDDLDGTNAHLKLRDDLAAFLTKAGRFSVPAGVTDLPVMMRGGLRWVNKGSTTPRSRAGMMFYALKSMSPRATLDGVGIMRALGVRHERSLPLDGKRCGTSESISLKARAAAGHRELTTLEELHAALHPPKKRRSRKPRRETAPAADYGDAARWRGDDLDRDFFEAEAGLAEVSDDAGLVEATDADWRDAPEADFDVA